MDPTICPTTTTSTTTKVAAVQDEDVLASFLFVDDLNGHHQEWLGSTTTNRHDAAPLTS